MLKNLLFYVCALTFCLGMSQTMPLSETAEISILTVGPGENLYDKFGHSAFRVTDAENNRDWAFNYGTYDFDTPNFYTKFAQGKLLYALSVEAYENFKNRYIREDRWIQEQVLNLSYSEKRALFDYLITNAQPENSKYKYDFFYDNCATKIRDVLVKALEGKVRYTDTFVDESYTFRQLIQKNVHWNSWGSLGMDVAIGAVTDKNASAWEYQFLPDYIFKAATTATIARNGTTKPLVKETNTIFSAPEDINPPTVITSPMFVFSVFAVLILAITYNDKRKQQRSRFLDATIFAVTGIIGILLCLLWFATDHSSTANNYNLLWAFPFSLPIAVAIGKKQPKIWVRRYCIFLVLLMVLLTMHWGTGVQEFAVGFIPLYIALLVRYLYVIYFLKSNTTA